MVRRRGPSVTKRGADAGHARASLPGLPARRSAFWLTSHGTSPSAIAKMWRGTL